jgi:hypothetical protein
MRYLLLLVVAVAAHGQFGAATSIVSGNGAPVAAQCTNANNVGRVWARKDGGAASTTFYICAATGAGTYGWQLNDGAIGGAASVASGQILYGTGAGQAGSEAAFAYNAATNLLSIGVGVATETAHIGRYTSGTVAALYLGVSSPSAANYVLASSGSSLYINSADSSSFIAIAQGNTERARFAATTGNLLLGTTTDDGTNRLQVAGSVRATGSLLLGNNNNVTEAISTQFRAGNDGSTSSTLSVDYFLAGTQYARTLLFGTTGAQTMFTDMPNNGHTWRSYSGFNSLMSLSAAGALELRNQTPTTGVTQLLVRAGAGQSTTNLQTWQNSSGTAVAGIESTGGFVSESTFFGVRVTSVYRVAMQPTGFNLANDRAMAFSSTSDVNGSKDLSLSRASAGVLQVGDGGANANGIVSAAGYRMALTTPASATATGTTGTIVWDADYVYVCTATNTWKRAAIATW